MRRLGGAAVVPLAAACGCVVAALLGLRSGLHGGAIARGFALLGVGAALAGATVRRPALRPRLTAAIASLVVSVYGAEAFVRAFTPVGLTPVARVLRARAAGVRYDVREQREVVADLRRAGTVAYPAIPPTALLAQDADGAWRSPIRVGDREVLPLGGIARVHTVFDNESGRYGEYDSDEHGFDNPPGSWSAPVSVALIGDSFTQGCGVPSDANLAAFVRRRYPRTVNLGMASSGPLAELGRLREFGPLLRPRVVLWDYFGNDLDDLEAEKRSLLARYLDPGFRQGLADAQPAIDSELARIVDATELSSAARAWRFVTLWRLRGLAGIGAATPPAHDAPRDLDLFQRVLAQAKREVEAWGGRLTFVYLPSWQHYAHKPLAEHQAEVLAIARDVGLDTIDIGAVFDREPEPLDLFPYRLPGHYNERGYRIAGEALASWLEASGALR